MKTFLLFLVISVSGIGWIGCSCCTFKDDASCSVHVRQGNTGSPTSIQPNLSYVNAVIDSVVIIDDIRYEVIMRLLSVTSAGSSESMAEQDQHVRVIPQFVYVSGNTIDMDNKRNKKLLSVRSATSGSRLQGSITLSQEGKWMLVDVNN